MKKLPLAFAIAAAALFGTPAANASDSPRKDTTGATQQSTDISSRHRHHRFHGHRHHHRHYGFRHYRPYYGNSYGYYAPRPYYGGYGYGGPGISFRFGSGGYRGW